MFDQTFVTTAAQRTRQPYTVLASTLLQSAVVLGFILASLLYTRALPMAQLKSMLVAPPPPVNVPKPPQTAERHTSPMTRVLRFQSLLAPVAIPKQIAHIDDAPAAPDISGAQSTDTAGLTGNPLLFGSTDAAPDTAPEPKMPTKPASAAKPFRIGGSVAEANLIHRVQPVYPTLAKAARIQGTVEFTALISKDGRIENLKLVSGHPLLVNAAREAILQWQYRPTLLNGEPVEVVTSIVVHFSLSE